MDCSSGIERQKSVQMLLEYPLGAKLSGKSREVTSDPNLPESIDCQKGLGRPNVQISTTPSANSKGA